jgi:hypothetical protein
MSEPQYQPTEEDILVALRYLRFSLPTYATPENAIKLLNYSHDHYKSLEELHPDMIEEVLKDLESY